MMQKFEMSMMGELNYFLGFQVKQLKKGTFISQTKYTQDLLKRFGMKDAVTPGFRRQTECELCTCQDQNSRTQRLHK